MKIKLIIVLQFFSLISTIAQPPDWNWSRSAAGTGQDEGMGISTDGKGNSYVIGYFSSPTITFDTITLVNSGTVTQDFFIVKYNTYGKVLWAKHAGGTAADMCSSISTTKNGESFVTGVFSSDSIKFGNITLRKTAGYSSVFIVKYDSNGNVLWAKASGGNRWNRGNSIKADKNGNCIVAGYFSSTNIIFDNDTLTDSTAQGNFFIVKYDSNGNLLWLKSSTNTNGVYGSGVSIDAEGNCFLTGTYTGTLHLDAITLIHNQPIGNDIFLAKYNPNGIIQWAKSIKGTGNQLSNYITNDALGNVLITGSFESSVLSFSNFNLTNSGGNCGLPCTDFFIAKYDASGNFLWAKGAEGESNEIGYSIVTDSYNSVYVAGGFSYQNTSSISFGNILLPYPGGNDPAFVTRYDPDGNLLSAFALKSGGDDELWLANDSLNNIYIEGDFLTDPFVFGTDSLHLIGTENIFVAKFSYKGGYNSIEPITENKNLLIFPNPGNGKVNITSADIIDEIIIHNTLGQIISFIKPNSSSCLINIEKSGIYFLTIQMNHHSFVKKLIVTD